MKQGKDPRSCALALFGSQFSDLSDRAFGLQVAFRLSGRASSPS